MGLLTMQLGRSGAIRLVLTSRLFNSDFFCGPDGFDLLKYFQACHQVNTFVVFYHLDVNFSFLYLVSQEETGKQSFTLPNLFQ